MSTFLDNHDVPRAIEHALDTPMFDPWDGGKWAAWSGQPQLPTSAEPVPAAAVAYAFLFTSPGMPMLYYGDEYGMPGAGDPDNRRFMQWSDYTANQTWLHDQIAEARAHARAAPGHPARHAHDPRRSGDVWVYEMVDGRRHRLRRAQPRRRAQSATNLPAGDYTDLITGDTVTAPLSIPPRSSYVLAQ